MRKIEAPELKFYPWFAWDERRCIPNCDMPGVYLISISKKNIVGKNPQWSDVSYIGMTNSRKGLVGRWQQFFNAIQGRNGHSGGNSVYSKLGHYNDWSFRLYVTAMPIKCNVVLQTEKDLFRMGLVAFLEYEAFAKFRSESSSRRKPEFNTR